MSTCQLWISEPCLTHLGVTRSSETISDAPFQQRGFPSRLTLYLYCPTADALVKSTKCSKLA